MTRITLSWTGGVLWLEPENPAADVTNANGLDGRGRREGDQRPGRIQVRTACRSDLRP